MQRLNAPTIATLDTDARISVDGAELGVAHPGEWWLDERAGDHKRARRVYVRLARDVAEHNGAEHDGVVVRRERAFVVRRSTVTITLGEVTHDRHVDGHNAVVLVEEERGLVVGVTLLWTSRKPLTSHGSRTASLGRNLP